MTTDIINLLANSNLTWAGGMTIIAFVMREPLVLLVRGYVDTLHARVEAEKAAREQELNLERERSQTDKDTVRALNELSEATREDREIRAGMLEVFKPLAALSTMPEALNEGIQQITKRAGEHDRALARLQDTAERIPQLTLTANKKHFDPKIEDIKTAIEALGKKIESRAQFSKDDVQEIRAGLVRIEQHLEASAAKQTSKVEAQNDHAN